MTYDRAAIMRDAHKRFRDGKRLGLGWSFRQCLATAWAAAKDRRKAIRGERLAGLDSSLPAQGLAMVGGSPI